MCAYLVWLKLSDKLWKRGKLMKKLAILILAVFLVAPEAHAAYWCPPAVVGGGVHGGAIFFPFALAVGGAIAVEVLNAEGASFPTCGDKWLTQPQAGPVRCFSEYPEQIHKDGV